MKKNTIHDGIVGVVEKELKRRGFNFIRKFEEYSSRGCCGEIDIYAMKDDYILNFEIKCSDCKKSYAKALRQLTRSSSNYFSRKYRVFNFYVCKTDEDDIVYKWIKK